MMKTYQEGCGVPMTELGAAAVPRLIMGIHPYDGCSYQDKERDAENLRAFGTVGSVVEVLSHTVEEHGITMSHVVHVLPHLDRLHLQAIWETERQVGVQIGLLAYILIPVLSDGEMVAYTPKAHATLYSEGERIAGDAFREHLAQDEVIRYAMGGSLDKLVTPATVAPYTPEEAARFEIDYAALERHLGFYAGWDITIADPGAEIDLLAMVGRFDLIRDYIAFLRDRFQTVVTSVHHAGITIPLLEREGIDVDGYLTPVNRLGMFMLPTRELALDAIQHSSRPILGMKPLAGGRFLGEKAFEFVFDEVGVATCLFGMGTQEQVADTAGAARRVLGVA